MTEELMVKSRGTTPSATAIRERLLEGAPVAERRIEAAGIATAVVEGGAGEPILLLHGPGEHVLRWLPVLPSLAATNRVIAPDLPGHGESGTAGAMTVDRALEWLGMVIDATCASPPTVVGLTLGGALAARFAAHHGERIRRLVLVDTLGLAPFQPAPEFGAALGRYLASPDESSFDGLMRYCAHDYERIRTRTGHEAWRMITAYTLDRVRDPAARATLDALMDQFGFPAIPPDVLERIRVPVTLVWGRKDLATSLSVAEAASARYGWPLHVIEDSGDDPALEEPERFVEVLQRL